MKKNKEIGDKTEIFATAAAAAASASAGNSNQIIPLTNKMM